jgi:predicted TIM-barrel fold metal-dependent hydrolase
VIWPILCDLDLLALADDDAFWTIIERHDLPVTVHVGSGDEANYRSAVRRNSYGPMDAAELAHRRPSIRFNLSHILRLSRPALQSVSGLRNVWTDLSGYSSFGVWREKGHDVFPAADPVVGPGEWKRLGRILEDEFGLKDRVMFGSSEPFCRWWGSSLQREWEICNNSFDVGFKSSLFCEAAKTFYKNIPVAEVE